MSALSNGTIAWVVVTALATLPGRAAAADTGRDYPVRPVAFTDVKIEDAFWTPRLETSRKVTIPTCFRRCEETGHIDNFAIAGGLKEGFYRGARYNDSDLHKVIEGASKYPSGERLGHGTFAPVEASVTLDLPILYPWTSKEVTNHEKD